MRSFVFGSSFPVDGCIVVVKGIYNSSMGNVGALALPTNSPRMSMWPVRCDNRRRYLLVSITCSGTSDDSGVLGALTVNTAVPSGASGQAFRSRIQRTCCHSQKWTRTCRWGRSSSNWMAL